MIRVEIDMFSGVPNPAFYLDGKAEREFLQMAYAQSDQLIGNRSDMLGLGFRGAIISLVKVESRFYESMSRKKRINIPDDFYITRGVSKIANDALLWLISEYQKSEDFQPLIQSIAIEEIINDRPNPVELPVKVTPNNLVVISGAGMCCANNFLKDNRDTFNASDRIYCNNCYCFGSNDLHSASRYGRYAAPGQRSGRGTYNQRDISTNSIIDRLLSDGWKHSCVPSNNLNIACIIRAGADFHFYRLTSTSPYIWCHKPGGTAARNVDANGRIVSNPQTCSWGAPYDTFVGYFYQDNNTAYVD